MEMENLMNTVADRTRPRHATASEAPRSVSTHALRASARRLAAWWSADPMSASFSASRERDQRVLQRPGR